MVTLRGIPAVKEEQALRYVGRVGTGFDDTTLRELRARLDAIETDANPFAEEPPDVDRVTFVRPELVAEVAYANETREGILRAPSFLRLRPGQAAVRGPPCRRTRRAPRLVAHRDRAHRRRRDRLGAHATRWQR